MRVTDTKEKRFKADIKNYKKFLVFEYVTGKKEVKLTN